MKSRDFLGRIFTFRNLVQLIIALFIGLLIFLLVYAYHDYKYIYAIDGLFAGGAALIGFGLLSFAANEGTFDIFNVGFANTFAVWKKNGQKKYGGLYEYRSLKEETRKSNRFSFLAYVIPGLLLVCIAGIMLAVFNSKVV